MKKLAIVVGLLVAWVPIRATVISQGTSVSFTCTGTVGPFPFTFSASGANAITVTQNSVTLSPSAYIIRPVNNNYDNGGSVTLLAVCPAAQPLVITRTTPLTQTTVFADNMPTPQKAIENGLDKLTEIAQELGVNGGPGSGTVSSVSVATANGFQGTVTNPSTTPSISINVDSTHILPVNTGNGSTYLSNAGTYTVPPGGSPLTTKGDIFGFSTGNARVPVGTNGQVLTADSTQALGVKWGNSSSSGFPFNLGTTAIPGTTTVSSVDGLTIGAVTPEPGTFTNLTATGELIHVNQNCTPQFDGGNTCAFLDYIFTAPPTQSGSGEQDGMVASVFTNGPAKNVGNPAGASNNVGWSVQKYQRNFLTYNKRGIKNSITDNAACYAVGDCITHYIYPLYDTFPTDASFEGEAGLKILNQEDCFLQGTFASVATAGGTGNFPPSSTIVTAVATPNNGCFHISDGAWLLDASHSSVAGSLNGSGTAFDTSTSVGSIPITVSSGSVPIITAWAKTTEEMGDTATQFPSNTPINQSFTVTAGLSTLTTGYACVVGGVWEVAKITNVSGTTITANIRYPHGSGTYLFQVSGGCPSLAIVITADTSAGMPSTYRSPGGLDSTHLLYTNQIGAGTAWNGQMPRSGDTPETTSSAFTTYTALEVTSVTTIDPFHPVTFTLEDTGFVPTVADNLLVPHGSTVQSCVFCGADNTTQFGNSSVKSALFSWTFGGNRITQAYHPLFFQNNNSCGAYSYCSGALTAPDFLTTVGTFRNGWAIGNSPGGSIISVGNTVDGNATTPITFLDLTTFSSGKFQFTSSAGPGIPLWDVSNSGNSGFKSNVFVFDKFGSFFMGRSNTAPSFNGIALGSTLDASKSRVNPDAEVDVGIMNPTTGYQLGGAAPSGHCLIGNGTNYVDSASCGGSGGISGLTAGYIPIAGSSSTLNANSHIDDSVTTASTLTATEPIAITASGIASQIALTPSGTSPAAVAGAASLGVPNTVTTAGVYLLPAAPASGIYTGANSSGVVTTTFTATTGSGNVVLATSPTLVSPALGGATATSLTVATTMAAQVTSASGSGGSLQAGALGVATNVANFSSVPFVQDGEYWDGSTAQVDEWKWQNVAGTGSNPTETLTLSHSGSSGAKSISMPFTATINGTSIPASATLTQTIANGTSALGTGAISSATCATVVTTTATGTATTDVVGWGFNGDPTGVTGYAPVTTGALTIFAYPSSGNVNFKVCNLTTASITPGAITLNWRITR